MKNEIAKMIRFETIEKMGIYEQPRTSLSDYSDEVYNDAAARCEIVRKETPDSKIVGIFYGGTLMQFVVNDTNIPLNEEKIIRFTNFLNA